MSTNMIRGLIVTWPPIIIKLKNQDFGCNYSFTRESTLGDHHCHQLPLKGINCDGCLLVIRSSFLLLNMHVSLFYAKRMWHWLLKFMNSTSVFPELFSINHLWLMLIFHSTCTCTIQVYKCSNSSAMFLCFYTHTLICFAIALYLSLSLWLYICWKSVFVAYLHVLVQTLC